MEIEIREMIAVIILVSVVVFGIFPAVGEWCYRQSSGYWVAMLQGIKIHAEISVACAVIFACLWSINELAK